MESPGMSFDRCKLAVVTGLLAAFTLGFLPSGANGQIPGRKVVAPMPKAVPPQAKPGVPMAPKAVTPQPKAPPGKAKGPKIPEPEELTLETNDGFSIKATYYAGTAKKDSVPVILVHAFEGQRGDFHQFALFLQSQGHAAIAPDLRGHGQSKTRNGMPITIATDKMTRVDLESMVFDIEACKKFLLDKNNSGDLNIELLTIVGAEFGGTVAVRWAARDWAARDLPSYKQGKDVKAIVLLSPQPAFKGVTMREAMAFPPLQSMVSMMLVAGAQDTKSSGEAKKLHNSLENHHPKLPENSEERKKVKSLYFEQPETKVSGTKLLANSVSVGGLTVREMVSIFIQRRLVDRRADFPWQDRQSPL